METTPRKQRKDVFRMLYQRGGFAFEGIGDGRARLYVRDMMKATSTFEIDFEQVQELRDVLNFILERTETE